MIYLDPEQHRALRADAAREGISMAELLRRLISRYLDERRGSGRASPEAYLKMVGLGASGRADISARHDAYLAGALRRERTR